MTFKRICVQWLIAPGVWGQAWPGSHRCWYAAAVEGRVRRAHTGVTIVL